MVDLFAEAVAEIEEQRRASDRANGIGLEEQSVTSVGGHSLRRRNDRGRTATIRSRTERPRSLLSPTRGLAAETQHTINLDMVLAAIPQQQDTSDESEDNNDDDARMGGDDDDPRDEDEEGNGDGQRNADDVSVPLCQHRRQSLQRRNDRDHKPSICIAVRKRSVSWR